VSNALIWGERSSGAVPFTTMSALVLLWFGISSDERQLDNSYWTKVIVVRSCLFDVYY
jgi:hypothetical protein